ncbi:MAG: DUF429 domain-containing protein [Firmicutes bacterium]|nr:DUF429 domain-containing protein [Bacillota bacterium]
MEIRVIGIDCATDPKKTGIAIGNYHDNNMEVLETRIPANVEIMYQYIEKWIKGQESILIAIDAPLGWPNDLGASLANHLAGENLSTIPNNLFRRETDRFVKSTIGKQPLDVGADRIARTAHAALRILNELRERTGKKISLAWNNESFKGIKAVEVYPAATLHTYGIKNTGYKGKKQIIARKEIIESLREHVNLPENLDVIVENDDALDSVICLLAAKNFIDGEIYYPENIETGKKEGWIWFRKPNI